MRYSPDVQPFALYRFQQPDEEYDLLLLSPVVCFTTDAVTFEPVVIPAIERGAFSVPSWVPVPEIIRASSLNEAGKIINARVADRVDADWDIEGWNCGWQNLYKCHWCDLGLAPAEQTDDYIIWLSLHDADCAVKTVLDRRARTKPRRVIRHSI